MAKTPEELQAEFQAEQNKRIKRQQAIRKQATDLEDAKAKEKLDKEKASLVEGQERTLKWYEDQKASGENIDEWEHPGGRNESRVGQSFMERAVEISKRPAWDDSTSTPAR
jgi:hypothetical protein